MIKRLFLIALFLAAAALLGACGPRSDDTTPEMAQRLLQVRGYHFTQEEFFKALRLRDGRAVKAFLQGGMDPNIKNSTGQTALTFALEVTDASMIEPLINNADLSLSDSAGNTPIFLALRYHHPEIFETLLAKNVDINSAGRSSKNVNKQTILALAVQRRNADLVGRLLEKGADPNLADDNGVTPLYEAVIGDNIDMGILRSLLEKGADPNYQGTVRGSTALIYVVVNFSMPVETKLEAIKLLIEKGADLNKQEFRNGQTALMYASLGSRSSPEAKIQMMKFLLENGADKTLKTTEGETVIELARKNSEPEVAAALK
jgi:ankyrin repeat protein